MYRYAAKLLFQFRAALGADPDGIMRTCEERIIVVTAPDAATALDKAKTHGGDAEFEGVGEAGNSFHFDFVGVMELLKLGCECEPEEVWYDIYTRKLPMERRERFIPPEDELNAVALEREAGTKPCRRTSCTLNPTPQARP